MYCYFDLHPFFSIYSISSSFFSVRDANDAAAAAARRRRIVE
jgi:hypothetical protein